MANEEKLPTPATTPEILAHAVVLELRQLNANFDKFFSAIVPVEPEQPATGDVELKEPEAKKPAHRDAKQAAQTVADEAVGPVTVETKRPGQPAQVDIVEPPKKG